MVRGVFSLTFSVAVLLAGGLAGPVSAAPQDACTLILAEGYDGPGADYVPGVDARGNVVAPADARGSYGWSDDQTISVDIDLAGRYGLGHRGQGRWVNISLNDLTIRGKDVYLNGYPLTQQDRSYLVQVCLKRLKDER